MKNIGKVFLSDAKRLSTNVVAIVIIMGLCILPALYAWFNILSNWNPYGEDATSQMNIAVFSEDKGFEYEKLSVNVGEKVVTGLKENTTIGWVFSDTKEEALDGVYSGECYAALIIPKDFTEDMISFINGDLQNPSIQYYENSKKNAIATKITSKAKTAVQEQVNSSFISTLAEVMAKTSETLTGSDAEGTSLMDTTLSRLEEMDTTLGTYENILSTFALVTSSASDLVGSTQSIIPNLDAMVDSGQNTVSNMQGSILSGAQTADTVGQMVKISMDTLNSGLESLSEQVSNISVSGDASKIIEQLNGYVGRIDELSGILGGLGNGTNKPDVDTTKLKEDMQTLADNQAKTQEELTALRKSISSEIATCQKAVESLRISFDGSISPNMNQSVYEVEKALIQTNSLLNHIDGSFSDVNGALESYEQTLNSGTDSITATRDYVSDIREGLGNVITGLVNLSSDEQYKEIVEMLETDPELISEFISSPVALDTEAVYEIETYGSAMAPFYTVLALWVGGLILVAIMHVKVEKDKELMDVKPHEAYFGRFITFFFVSQIQALIAVLGDLFFVQIQCVHPVLFWLAAACTSFVFTIFMYSLTVAFGNVGEAIAVVILVIQVAGAGGTFPIEVLPEVYQAIYKFLPFTYCMNALRECVGGMYQLDYVKDLGILGIFVLVSLFIGLVAAIPFRGMNEKIEKSKERSRVMM